MDNKTSIPPYEQNPAMHQSQMHTANSYSSQPQQHDITPLSPNTYPHAPPGSPPPALYHDPNAPDGGMEHPKGDYYGKPDPLNPTNQIPMDQMPPQYPPHPPTPDKTAYLLQNLNSTAAPVDCPVCHQRALTRIQYMSGNTTHGLAALLCFCFCLGCIPYMMSSQKDVEHKCGNCGVTLAHWHKSGHVDIHAHA